MAEITYNQNDDIIGKGCLFPLKLDKGSLQPVSGDIRLIENNLHALIDYHIGQRLRNEEFGTRLWECLEEPNTDMLTSIVEHFAKEAFDEYEQRITLKKTQATRYMGHLYIRLTYELTGTSIENQMDITY